MLAAIALVVAGCTYRIPHGNPPSLSCLERGEGVAWTRAPADRRLDWWCAQVGPPLIADLEDSSSTAIDTLIVVSWNVHVGAARIGDLIARLRPPDDPASSRTGLVFLLQEAYRSSADVPAVVPGGAVPGRVDRRDDAVDIAALARDVQMAVAYVPSMRNGDVPGEHVDRGNAILSTEPLSDVAAIELPFGRQRRVATSALVHPRGAEPLRMIAAHFDSVLNPTGQRRQAVALAEHVTSLNREGRQIVLAADTNARLGRHDRTVRSLARVLPLVRCRPGAVLLHSLEMDFLFSNLDRTRVQSCAADRKEYGSDHRPLVMTIDLGE